MNNSLALLKLFFSKRDSGISGSTKFFKFYPFFTEVGKAAVLLKPGP